MRVSELAKALKIPSKDLLVKLKELRIPAKAPTSTLDADQINRARKALSKPPAPKKPAVTKVKPGINKAAAAVRTLAAAAKPVPKPGAKPAAKAAPAAPVKAEPEKPKAAPAPAARPAAPAPAAKAAPASAGTATLAPPKAPVPAKPHAAPVLPPVAAGKPKPIPVAPPPAKAEPEKPKAAPAPAPAPVPAAAAAPAGPKGKLQLRFPVTVKDLADQMGMNGTDVVKYLMSQKIFASMVHPLDEAKATKVAEAFNWVVAPQPSFEDELLKTIEPDPKKMVPRAPVVTFMGHVDHGKTSLLDAIREAKVAEKEAGGITQHIGAYEVELEKGHVTFLDTPGHEAFTALRARGANATDVVVLVVAADDGVMPQTVEAIDHAKAAGVPIIVAMNKMDKAEANPEKLKQQLSQYELIGEDWGGQTIMVPVSARSRQGIDQLLEMLLLEAELLELKADPTVPAQGVVIEAKQTKERGPVATLLVQHGTLRVGETVVIGHLVGRVRAMIDAVGRRIKEAGPAKPVEILGLPEVPHAGDRFVVVADEKVAKQLAERRLDHRAQHATNHPKRITLQELHQRIADGQLKDLKLVVKADVQGSLEAIVQSLQKLDTEKEEIQFKILHMGVGDISESDVILAAASDAILVGFHVGINPMVQVLAANEGVDVHIYQIIYELVGAIKAAIEGMLEPDLQETFIGRAEILKLFQVSKSGIVAGCRVLKGSIRRDCIIRVIRGKDRLGDAPMTGLKRVKDDVREVQEGVECGILLQGSVSLQVGDLLEAWEIKKVARKLA